MDNHSGAMIDETPPQMGGRVRIPGTYPPEWLPDQEADACMSCETHFTVIKRRHHCRSCGKIFCADCCKLKAKLLYLENKEARVCDDCHQLIGQTLSNIEANSSSIGIRSSETSEHTINDQNSSRSAPATATNATNRVHGVLKTSNQNQVTNASNSSLEHVNKQVIFSDGIRPGTDLSESQYSGGGPVASSSSSSNSLTATLSDTSTTHQIPSTASMLTRQNQSPLESNNSPPISFRIQSKGTTRSGKQLSSKSVTVCDELGYLPPIVIARDSAKARESNNSENNPSSTTGSQPLASLIVNQIKATVVGRKQQSVQASIESRSCPLNGTIKFEEISGLVGVDHVVTFLLLKDFYLKVKIIQKDCCMKTELINELVETPPHSIDKNSSHEHQQSAHTEDDLNSSLLLQQQSSTKNSSTAPAIAPPATRTPTFWCFTSDGLSRFGQSEIVLVLHKNPDDHCLPRDVFKIYLTLHELALRRQILENLGNLLFQDGLFGSRDSAGLVLVRPLASHCLNNIVLPADGSDFLIALVLQRWEVPWSKVFPMRLLLRLGYKYDVYPYPVVSFRFREPVYYEVGHTIISILGDFRNFRYSMIHVDGLKVIINKATRKVCVQLKLSNYQQFNKVLDSSNNEHVLAWSSCPSHETDGHLVALQTDDGQYETVEFYNRANNCGGSSGGGDSSERANYSFSDLNRDEGPVLGASFIIFSGALKVNQTGQPAKISVVEDGILIQIQSCTMTALKNAIHFMHHFDIDCESNQDVLNRVEIDWLADGEDAAAAAAVGNATKHALLSSTPD